MANQTPRTHAEATIILTIFWALARLNQLREKDTGIFHTVRNIQDTINHPKLNNDTVSKWRDFLEKHGAIVCNYKRNERRGRRFILYELYPEKIPPSVYKKRLPPSTATRYKQEMEKLGLARYVDGYLRPDIEGLSDLLGMQFSDYVRNLIEVHEGGKEAISSIDDFDYWILEDINGQEVKFPTNTLEFFHHWVCLMVSNMKS